MWASLIVMFRGITVFLITDLVSAFYIYVAYLVFEVCFNVSDIHYSGASQNLLPRSKEIWIIDYITSEIYIN